MGWMGRPRRQLSCVDRARSATLHPGLESASLVSASWDVTWWLSFGCTCELPLSEETKTERERGTEVLADNRTQFSLCYMTARLKKNKKKKNVFTGIGECRRTETTDGFVRRAERSKHAQTPERAAKPPLCVCRWKHLCPGECPPPTQIIPECSLSGSCAGGGGHSRGAALQLSSAAWI